MKIVEKANSELGTFLFRTLMALFMTFAVSASAWGFNQILANKDRHHSEALATAMERAKLAETLAVINERIASINYKVDMQNDRLKIVELKQNKVSAE